MGLKICVVNQMTFFFLIKREARVAVELQIVLCELGCL